jgi:lysophospholipase L1-like esterase
VTIAVSQQSADPCRSLKEKIDSMQATLSDWPNLGRYADHDAKLKPPAKGERRVVFLGDSITDSWNLSHYFPHQPYVNRGISGQTTPQMLVRFRPDVINLQPKVVVILAGTNDLAGNTGPMTLQMIEYNFASTSDLARSHSIALVFASLLPVSDYGPDKQTMHRSPEKIRQLNAWIQQYCQKHGLIYLDYYSHLLDKSGMLRADLSQDGLHPNAAGYKIMAPLADAAIRKALYRSTVRQDSRVKK